MDDGAVYPQKWSNYIKEAEDSLTSSSFLDQHLDVNFRNANEIFECSNGIEENQFKIRNQNVSGQLTTVSTVSSLIPRVF